MPSMGAQAAGEGLIGAHRRDRRSRSLLHFLPLPPLLLLLHSWPKSCGPISWPQYHSKENHNIEGDSYQETVVAETSNVSFGSPLRARARPRLPPLLSGRRAAAAHRCSLSRKLPSAGLLQSRLAQSHSAHQSTETGGEMWKMWKEVTNVSVPTCLSLIKMEEGSFLWFWE